MDNKCWIILSNSNFSKHFLIFYGQLRAAPCRPPLLLLLLQLVLQTGLVSISLSVLWLLWEEEEEEEEVGEQAVILLFLSLSFLLTENCTSPSHNLSFFPKYSTSRYRLCPLHAVRVHPPNTHKKWKYPLCLSKLNYSSDTICQT